MNKKKIVNEPIFIVLFIIYLIIIFMLFFLVIIKLSLTGIIVSSIISLMILMIYFVFMNYMSCIVEYNGLYITRKGLIFGYKLKIEVKDIVDIRILHFGRAPYYELYDGVHFSLGLFSKNTSIRIACNDKAKDFIKTFWSGDIPNL